jgi:UDP-N-acetylglucosamine 2-epimerase (non-hydrolysing)
LIFTGQHPSLSAGDYGVSSFDAVKLACPGKQDPHSHVGNVAAAFSALVRGLDLLIVQGDTSSALGAALAASAAGVPVAHVEAGLRSHDRRYPWPEEEYRLAIDSLADLLFAPTALAAANLRRERLHGTVHISGNTAVDAARGAAPARHKRARVGGPPHLLVTCHRRESWGDGLADIAAALRMLADERSATIDFVLHPNPAIASRMRELLVACPDIRLCPPCDHHSMIRTMFACDLVLSDSGGLQEEAAALGVPLLVLRDRTERPEAIASGNVGMAGTNSDTIVHEARRLLRAPDRLARMARPSTVFGDGNAAERIAGIVSAWLTAKIADEAVALPPAIEIAPLIQLA